jgi:hypothetical protein
MVEHIYETERTEIAASIERLEKLLADVPADQIFNRLSLDLRLRQMQLIQKWMSEINFKSMLREMDH